MEKKKSDSQRKRGEKQNNELLGMYSYQLIQFLNESSVDGLLSIECVPHIWLDYDEENNKCVSKYMPPPYTKIKTAILDKMIRKKDEADDDWPTYEVEIKGQAETYAEALKKLKVLQEEEFVFTSEPDTTKREKSQQLHKMVLKKRLEKDRVDKLLQVPDISSSSDAETEFPIDRTNSPLKSDNEILGEISFDENRNLSNVNTRNTKSKANQDDTYSETSTAEDQNIPTPKQRNIKKTSSQRTIPSKYHGQPTKSSSSQFTQVADSAESTSITKNKSKFSSETIERAKNNKIGTVPKNIQDPERSPTARNQNLHRHKVISSGYSTAKSLSKSKDSSTSHGRQPSTSSTEKFDKVSSDRFEKVEKDCKSIKQDLITIKMDIANIKNLLTNVLENVPALIHLTFEEKHSQDIPFTTVAAFQDFDKDLKNDKELRKEFIQSLQISINASESLSKIIVNILRKYLSRDVALEYTAIKAIGDKKIMKDTCFCGCILRAFEIKMTADPKLAAFSEKIFYEKLGAVLGNVRDWDGGRTPRRAKKYPNE